MSESLSTELSYGEPFGYSPESGSPSTSSGHDTLEAVTQHPAFLDPQPPAPDAAVDTQPDNRLSVVSAASLEPRRRSRPNHGRHSHLPREVAHMLAVSARDAKELLRGLAAASDKLDESRTRASRAEKLALDMLLRVQQAEDERANAMREASSVREELGKYKALLAKAQGEIQHAQRLLEDQEVLRNEAEASAARARADARQMKQMRLVEIAREQGRKLGYHEGVQAGQRLGYHEGQGSGIRGREPRPALDADQPRFHELFDDERFRLDEFDQPPPFPNIYEANIDPPPQQHRESPSPTYPALQQTPRGLDPQSFNEPGSPNTAVIPPRDDLYVPSLPSQPEVLYAPPVSPRAVQRTTPSVDSSSTTSLPAAPPIVPVSSRAPPPMPTIPEVVNTEVDSASRRSRSLRSSQRHSGYSPRPRTPPTPTRAVVPPTILYTPSQGSAAFVPPPGSVDDIPSGFVNEHRPSHTPMYFPPPPGIVDNVPPGFISGYPPGPAAPIYSPPTPTRGFDSFATASADAGIVPDVTRGSAEEHTRAAQVPGSTRRHAEGLRLVDELRNPDSLTLRAGGRQDTLSPPRRDGPPRRRPIPQMPAPLAPFTSTPQPTNASVSYGHGSYGPVPSSRPAETNNMMYRDMNLPSTLASAPSRNHPSSQGVYERTAHSVPSPQTVSGSTQAPPLTPPRGSSDRYLAETSGRHEPLVATTSPRPPSHDGGRFASPHDPPRIHVQVPPTGYYSPTASPRSSGLPVAFAQTTPTRSEPPPPLSPAATLRRRASDVTEPDVSYRQSPIRYPPTLYDEPRLQPQYSTNASTQRRGESSPVSPDVPQNFRVASPVWVPPPTTHSRGGSRSERDRAPSSSPRTPADALPIPPPSMSPHPSPAAFARHILTPQGTTTSPVLRRATSPGPLPRASSPAPLPRAASPSPLPVRSPSVRSTHIRRSASDVSLPGAPGSPYMHYNPGMEADIAALASSSAERLTAFAA